ncbi:MAG TPA: hypothetical protein PLC65_05295 [Bacteroidia bacterium]|nr:hypothetical protein [Bacteroidia bacterium]HRD38025.1 hypothetical protein [Bacteroidia bacterium]
MKINLLNGNFSRKESLDLITKMIHVKVKFHEDKIASAENEEDIKMRETRIRQLQKDLYEVRNLIESSKGNINLTGEINL